MTFTRVQYWNLVKATARMRRRLQNSMAHTPKPRPADLARWRAMEAEIARREAEIAKHEKGTRHAGA